MTVLDNARRMAAARYGMRVVDRAGAPVGFVCAIKRADHLAVNAAGQRIGHSSDLLALVPGALVSGEPRVGSPATAARLVRRGYLKIDGSRVDRVNRYADAEEIAEISEGLVRLSVARDALVTQRGR
jgi:hypothetical protein